MNSAGWAAKICANVPPTSLGLNKILEEPREYSQCGTDNEFMKQSHSVVDTYAYRTTVTTVQVDEGNQGRQQRCRQMSAREELRSCEQYLRQQSRDVLPMNGIDNLRRSERAFDECCRELRNMDEQCRCDMLEEIVREEQRQEQGREGMQMLQKAKNLPSMCGLRPQQCHFQGQQQRCGQMSAREELRSCEQYLRQQSRDVLQMKGIDNPRRSEQTFDECCRELRNVDEQCRCDMLEEIVRKELRGQEGMQMSQKAKNLPSMCGLRPQQCHFQGQQQRCGQMSAREELRSCEQYLRQQSKDVLQMKGIDNPRRSEGAFDECCRELRNVDEQCRCDMLKDISRKERGQEGMQMLQKAKNLPSMCGLRPQQCHFQWQQQRCGQMSAREELRSCEQYLRQQSRDVQQMRGIDNPKRSERAFDECCRELRNVDEQCRCDMLKEIAREEQRQERGQEGMQMLQKAKNLPSMCGLRPQQCHF